MDIGIIKEWHPNVNFAQPGASTSCGSVTDSGSSTRSGKISKLSRMYRNVKFETPKVERTMVIDLAPDSEDFDPDNYAIVSPDHPNYLHFQEIIHEKQFKRNSFGELVIQPGQPLIKKKKTVRFDIPETSQDSENEDPESDDDSEDNMPLLTRLMKIRRTRNDEPLTIAERVKNTKRNKTKPTPPPSTLRETNIIDARVQDKTDPLLLKIFDDTDTTEFLGFDPIYNPYVNNNKTSVLVEPAINISHFKTLKSVHQYITKDTETSLNWLKEMELVASNPSPCPECNADNENSTNLRRGRKGQLKHYHSAATDRKCNTYMQCTGAGSSCRYRASPFTNTFFDGTTCKLNISDVIEVLWCWINKISIGQCHLITGVSKNCIIDYYNYCREICAVSLASSYNDIIGGVGYTIEIDESKLFKRKYHRGRYLSMQERWAFGGKCRETKAKFIVLVPDRSEATLLPIIKHHIKPGSTIISDEWRAYYNLDRHGYIYHKINHSQNFVDPVDPNIHTQSIESNWHYLKHTFPKK